MPAILKRDITHEVEIPMSGYDVATLFWELDADEQALFFHRLSQFKRLPFQFSAVTDSDSMTTPARRVMALIGEYSQQS